MVLKMNEVNSIEKRRRTTADIDKLIIEKVSENPSGVTFGEIQKGTGLSPSVLTEHLKSLTEQMQIEKSESIYRVEGMGAYRTVLNLCIPAIDKFLENKYDKDQVRYVLDELVGSPGKSVPPSLQSKYISLANDRDALTLLKFAEKVMGKYYNSEKYSYEEYTGYVFGVIQFATAILMKDHKNTVEWKDEVLAKQIWKISEEIVKKAFYFVSTKEPEKTESNSAFIKDVKLVLDRILYLMAMRKYHNMWKVVEEMIQPMNKEVVVALSNKDRRRQYYGWLYSFMLNSSWLTSEYVLQVLASNQGKLFTMAMGSLKDPEKRNMIQNLRKYILENTNVD